MWEKWKKVVSSHGPLAVDMCSLWEKQSAIQEASTGPINKIMTQFEIVQNFKQIFHQIFTETSLSAAGKYIIGIAVADLGLWMSPVLMCLIFDFGVKGKILDLGKVFPRGVYSDFEKRFKPLQNRFSWYLF